jgi:hypothetical protein
MKTWLGWLSLALVVVGAGSYAWTHKRRMAVPADSAPATEQPKYAEQDQARQMVTVTGPLADYMAHQKPGVIENLQPISHKTVESDHLGESPVGTSVALLHKTFSVANVADLQFDLPAHASTPQLNGTYRSFLQRGGTTVADEASERLVEFLVLNQQQYSDFLNGRPSDALFSAEGAAEEEINFSLPPTMSRPVAYHLVFRNSSRETGKKVVQADFRIDF